MKNLCAFIMILVCAGCTTTKTYNQQYQMTESNLSIEKDYKTMEANLAESKNINEILKIYKELFNNIDESSQYCLSQENSLFTTIQPENVSCFMVDSDQYNSDKCILARRNSKQTKICYFNYLKYLPKEFNKYTEDDFLELVYVYSQMNTHKQKCYSDTQLTSTERMLCADRIDKYMHDFAWYKAKNNSGLKTCISTKPKEYKDMFLWAPNREYGWFSYDEKFRNCNTKDLNNNKNKKKKEFMEHAQTIATCGTPLSGDFSANSLCAGSNPLYLHNDKEKVIKEHKIQQTQKFVDFGIKNNCYTSLHQLIKDNYDFAMQDYEKRCKEPIRPSLSPVLDVRIVE